jgi:hypothetical protein
MLRRYFGKISPLTIQELKGQEGEFVIDESTNRVYVMDGITPGGKEIFRKGSFTEPSAAPPTEPSEGQLWYDCVTGRLYIWFNNEWVDASPPGGGGTLGWNDIYSSLLPASSRMFDIGSDSLRFKNLYLDSASLVNQNGNTLLVADLNTSVGLVNSIYSAAVVVDDLAVNITGHVIPEVDGAYDLGSATNKWRHIYTSGQSISIGAVTLSESGGKLVARGNDKEINVITLDNIEPGYKLKVANLTAKNKFSTTKTVVNNNNTYKIILPFAINFLGTFYSEIYLHSNSYLTFGASGVPNNQDISFPLSPGVALPIPAIFIGAANRILNTYSYGLVNGNTYRIRYEGVTDANDKVNNYNNLVWEIIFYQDKTSFDIIADLNMPSPSGVWGISDGYKWLDSIPALPVYDTVANTIYNSVQVDNGARNSFNVLRFTGPGVDQVNENGVLSLHIDPFQNHMNVGFDFLTKKAIFSSTAGSLKLTNSEYDTSIEIAPQGPLYLSAGSRNQNIQGDGYNLYIKAGDGSQTYDGGSVNIVSGFGSTPGSPGDIQLSAGENFWRFDNAGNLYIPIGGHIKWHNGIDYTALAEVLPGTTGNWIFSDNLISLTNTDAAFINNQGNLTVDSTDTVTVRWTPDLTTPTPDSYHAMYANNAGVFVDHQIAPGTNKVWSFSTDGNLYLPLGGTIFSGDNRPLVNTSQIGYISDTIYNDAAGRVVIANNLEQTGRTAEIIIPNKTDLQNPVLIHNKNDSGISLIVGNILTGKSYNFNSSGNFTLPAGSQILNNDGTPYFGNFNFIGNEIRVDNQEGVRVKDTSNGVLLTSNHPVRLNYTFNYDDPEYTSTNDLVVDYDGLSLISYDGLETTKTFRLLRDGDTILPGNIQIDSSQNGLPYIITNAELNLQAANVNLYAGEHKWSFDPDGILNLTNNGTIRNIQDSKYVNIVASDTVQLQWTTDTGAASADPNSTTEPTNWLYLDNSGLTFQSNVNSQATYSWHMGTDGTFTLPNGKFGNPYADGALNIIGTAGAYGELISNDLKAVIWVADTTFGNPVGGGVGIASNVSADGSGGYSWLFANDGTMNLPQIPELSKALIQTTGNICLLSETSNFVLDTTGNLSIGNYFLGNLIGQVTGDVTGNVYGNVSGNLTGNVTGDVTGNLYGNVTGNVLGNVTGDVTGNLYGNVTGNVTGDVTGNLYGQVNGDVTGNLYGNVAGNVTGDVLGNLHGNVTGNVTGDVKGDLYGNVTGNVTGDVTGNLNGQVTGDVHGNVTGNLTGDVTGNLYGQVTGDVTGNLSGNVTGNVTGDLYGNVTGDVTGNITGNVTGNVTGNLYGNVTGSITGDVTGNISGTDATFANSVVTTGNVQAGNVNVIADVNINGNLFVAGNVYMSLSEVVTNTEFVDNITANAMVLTDGPVSALADTGNAALLLTGNGGLAVGGNVNIQGTLWVNNPVYFGEGSPDIFATDSVMTGRGSGNTYTQIAMISTNKYGSADYAAYADNWEVNHDHGWVDMGFCGSEFTDPDYTITKPNDGYVFVSPVDDNFGGNLVLCTDTHGFANDILFGVNGFFTENEVMRIKGQTREIIMSAGITANSSTSGTLQITGGAGITGNLYVGNYLSGANAGFANVSLNQLTANSIMSLGDISIQGNLLVNGSAVGFRDIPQLNVNGPTTLALTDAGKHYYTNDGSVTTITIPASSSVDFNIGTAITFVVSGTGSLNIQPDSSVTLYLAGNTVASSRVVDSYGMATLIKVETDVWFINGAGVI